jgi:lipoate-protein ligase A
MSTPAGWTIEYASGSAVAFHAWEPEAGSGRLARWFSVDRPALVLGSAQRDEVVDVEACAAAGVEVVRRRSGGGAVLLLPGEVTWLDVVVPVGDPLWVDDVGRSMLWFGEVWADALRALGESDVAVHRGTLRSSEWSRLVCFDGLGPGEVTVAGHKTVGISQRRTRAWARLQAAVYHRWRPEMLLGLLRGPVPAVDELQSVHAVPDAEALMAAMVRQLPHLV